MGLEAMGSEAHIMGSEAMGLKVMGSEATASTTGIEAHGSALGSGSGQSGGLLGVGGRTGLMMRTPPVVVAPSLVVVQPSPHYWYYCDASHAYYPYVQHCPGGWRQVLPTPPP
jgi:hypothetical protein